MNVRAILGVPDVLDARKIVAVQPHPDDNEVNIGGTLLTLRHSHCEIVFVTVTDGSAGAFGTVSDRKQIARVRAQEKYTAGERIGVCRQVDFGFEDGSNYPLEDVTVQLVDVFRKERPDVVLSVDPWMPYEAHPDHIKVGMAVSRAVLFSNNAILYPSHRFEIYQVPQVAFYATSYPNTFIDISSHMTAKLAAIKAHKSQFDNHMWPQMKQYFELSARDVYEQWKRTQDGFAEALKVLSYRQLHSLPSTVYN